MTQANSGMFRFKNLLPFAITVRFNPDVLAEAIADAAPIGAHTHDKGIQFNRAGFPRAGGRLKNWFRNKANWHMTAPIITLGGGTFNKMSFATDQKKLRVWTQTPSNLKYAAIQEFGGKVGPAKGRMVWNDGGVIIRAYKRKGYEIKAQEYAKKGLTHFAQNDLQIRVEWK
jgi:hypothetical protein